MLLAVTMDLHARSTRSVNGLLDVRHRSRAVVALTSNILALCTYAGGPAFAAHALRRRALGRNAASICRRANFAAAGFVAFISIFPCTSTLLLPSGDRR